MKRYEMLYIIASNLSEEVRESIIVKFEGIVSTNGGKVEKTDKWGMKKLAYPINYRNDGFYVLMTFECEPSLIVELERNAGITEGIIRRMITVIA